MSGLDRIAMREKTIADTFRASGYSTGLIGKWHKGSLDRRYEPNERGFEEFVGFCGGWSDYYEWHLRFNDSLSKGNGDYMTDEEKQVIVDKIQAIVDEHNNNITEE